MPAPVNPLSAAELAKVLPNAILAVDADGCVVLVNPPALALFHGLVSDVRGQVLSSLPLVVEDPEGRTVPPEHWPILRALASRGAQDGTLVLVRPDGTRLWLEIQARPTPDGGAVAIYSDVTRLRATQVALRQSEERLKSLLETVPGIAVQGYAADGTVQYWNRASERLYGYSREEALGGNLLDLIIPEPLRETVARDIAAAVQEGREIPSGELRLMSKDGAPVDVFSTHVVVASEGNAPELFCLDVDLAAVGQARAALAASEARFRGLFESMQEGFALHELILDEAGTPCDYRYLAVNAAFEAMTGIPRERWLGHTVREVLPEVEPKWIEVYGRVALTGRSETIEDQVPELGRTYRVVAYAPAPMQFAVLVEDVTETRRLAMEADASRASLEALFDQNETAMSLSTWPEGRILTVNSAWERVTGLAAEDALGRTVEALNLFPSASEVQAVLQALSTTGRAEGFELTLAGRDGIQRRLLWSGQVTRLRGQDHLVSSAVEVTALVEALELLRRSEAKFEAVFRSSPDAIALNHLETGAFLDVNPAFTELTGYDLEEAGECSSLPNGLGIWVDAGDPARVMELLSRQGEVSGFEARIRRRDGGERSCLFSASFIEMGGDQLVLSTARDITERHQMEAQLRQVNAQLQGLVSALPDLVLLLDAEDRVQEVCAPTDTNLLAPREAALGQRLDAFLPGTLGEQAREALERIRSGEPLVSLEYSLDLQALRYYEARFTPAPEGGAVILVRDVTDRVEAREALQASEARLLTVTRNAPDTIVQLDRAGRILYINKLVSGFRTDQVLGQSWMGWMPRPEDQAIAQAALDRLLATAEETDFEVQGLGAGGGLRWYRTRLSPVWERGEVTSVILFSTDITDQLRLAQEREHLELQVRHAQKMESLGSLAGGVAHDMNNVLGAILGLTTAFRVQEPDGTRLAKVLDTITMACERGGTLVRGLLNFTRQSLAEERLVDLNALVREEVQLLERTTLQKVRLVMDLAPDLRPVRGDGSALSHALMNLCVNAVDAMPEGGTLTLGTRNLSADHVQLVVEDTGSGMAPEVLEKALDPFFTTKPQGKGTGLGLSIVYGTVKAHRGRLELQSQPGSGTRAILSLPAAESEPAPVPDAPAVSPGAALRVLLVDDDELIQQSMELLLQALGVTPVVASSGEEALERLRGGLACDAVILDMNMPGLGGEGTLPRLRELHPDVPILLATGRADQRVLDLVAGHSGVEILSKPFGLETLRQALGRLQAPG